MSIDGSSSSRNGQVARLTARWCCRDVLKPTQTAVVSRRARSTGDGTSWRRPASCGAVILSLILMRPAVWRYTHRRATSTCGRRGCWPERPARWCAAVVLRFFKRCAPGGPMRFSGVRQRPVERRRHDAWRRRASSCATVGADRATRSDRRRSSALNVPRVGLRCRAGYLWQVPGHPHTVIRARLRML